MSGGVEFSFIARVLSAATAETEPTAAASQTTAKIENLLTWPLIWHKIPNYIQEHDLIKDLSHPSSLSL